MFLKVRYVCLIAVVFLILWQIYTKYPNQHKGGEAETEPEKEILKRFNKSLVPVSVYYEALCPDSRSFFVRHLLPVYLKMGQALDLELIPYGHAKTFQVDEGKFEFECQHGPAECFGNKIHACAIINIEDTVLRLKYLTCLIDTYSDPEIVGAQCSEKMNVQWKAILHCANGTQGDWLLKNHGEETDKLKPPVSFVPTILLNHNHFKQSAILKNLNKELCSNFKDELSEYCS